MDSEDGHVFVKNLAYFVRTHERALANALQLQRQHNKNGQQATAGSSNPESSASTSIKLSEALTRPYISFTSNIKPAKLTLTPHHLFFLLSKFEDLGVDVGPMNVRLENLQHDAGPSNYVSFLGHAPKSRGKQSDADSLKSVSSVRSVMSSMSNLWSSITMANSAAKAEKQMAQYREDIKYLYSCFTKIPALKLSPDNRARLVSGYEEFPFDTAVPLFAFKNVSALEICDLDFRQFHGWDRLSEQLRSLTVRRASVDEPLDLLQHIVLDDMEKRRKRSFKVQHPTTPSTHGTPWPSNSPKARQIELARTMSAPNSPFVNQRSGSQNSPPTMRLNRKDSSDGKEPSTPQQRQRSSSPARPSSSRQGSLTKHARNGSLKYRRSSGSSESTDRGMTPRRSTTDLLALNILPSSKWRFLRHLSLAENGLTSLNATSLAPVADTLHSLDLSSNLFYEVPDALASLTYLRALNLSNCMIESLQSLSRNPLPAINTLNLRSNRLLNLAGIERLFSLERVDVRDNRLRDPMELARLASLPEIVDLYVLKNPFQKTHSNYRVTIFNAFRSTPGHVQDVTIDTLGPLYTEKQHLVDRAPEPTNIPVVKPPTEDESEDEASQAAEGASMKATNLRPLPVQEDGPSHRHRHRRAVSDVGPQTMRRKKRTPRRRLVELSPSDSPSKPTPQHPTPDLAEEPRTPTYNGDRPSTPNVTPYHTAPTTQIKPMSSARPTLNTAFESPTPAPKIRDPSDDDLSPIPSSPHDTEHSDVYRQKIAALKTDFGPNWLSVLNEDRITEQKVKDRSFSPSSRTSTVRADNKTVVVGGRTLG